MRPRRVMMSLVGLARRLLRMVPIDACLTRSCQCKAVERDSSRGEPGKSGVFFESASYRANFFDKDGRFVRGLPIYYCYACGGSVSCTAAGGVADLRVHPEVRRLQELTSDITSLRECVRRLGPPSRIFVFTVDVGENASFASSSFAILERLCRMALVDVGYAEGVTAGEVELGRCYSYEDLASEFDVHVAELRGKVAVRTGPTGFGMQNEVVVSGEEFGIG